MKMARPRSTAVTRVGSLLLVALWHVCYFVVKTVLHSAETRHQGIPLWHAEPLADTISHTPLSHKSIPHTTFSLRWDHKSLCWTVPFAFFLLCCSSLPLFLVSLHIGFFALLLSSPQKKNNLVLQFQERPHPLVALGSTPRQTEFQLAAGRSSDTCKMLLIQLPFCSSKTWEASSFRLLIITLFLRHIEEEFSS